MIQITIHGAAAAVAVLGAAALGVVRRVLSCRYTAFVTTGSRARLSSSPTRPGSSSSSRPATTVNSASVSPPWARVPPNDACRGDAGGKGHALSTGDAKRLLKASPGSTAKWSGPNVTVKFSMNPICPRMMEVPWCGHGSSTPASPCHDRRGSLAPTGGIACNASSNSRASNARPPSRIGSVCPVAIAASPAEAITSSETTVSGPPVSISAVNDDRRPGTATRTAARRTGRPSVPCDSPKSV